MLRLSGKSVCKGIAVGPVLVLRQEEQQVRRSRTENPDAEMWRVHRERFFRTCDIVAHHPDHADDCLVMGSLGLTWN